MEKIKGKLLTHKFIIEHLAGRARIAESKSNIYIRELVEMIKSEVLKGNSVQIMGLGTFCPVICDSRVVLESKGKKGEPDKYKYVPPFYAMRFKINQNFNKLLKLEGKEIAKNLAIEFNME